MTLGAVRPRRWVLRSFRFPEGAGERDLLQWIGVHYSVCFDVDGRTEMVPLVLWMVHKGSRWPVWGIEWEG